MSSCGTARDRRRKEQLVGLAYKSTDIDGELTSIHRPRLGQPDVNDMHEARFNFSAKNASRTPKAARFEKRSTDIACDVLEALRVLRFRHGSPDVGVDRPPNR